MTSMPILTTSGTDRKPQDHTSYAAPKTEPAATEPAKKTQSSVSDVSDWVTKVFLASAMCDGSWLEVA